MSDKKSSKKKEITPFKKWIKKPVGVLKKMKGNDGGFVILLISLILYESNLKYILKENKSKVIISNARNNEIQKDFNIDENGAKIFWKVMRNGLAHTGMPEIPAETDNSKKIQYKISKRFKYALKVDNNIIKINISKFYETVIKKCAPRGSEPKISAQWPCVWQSNMENTNNNESNSQNKVQTSGTQFIPITGSYDPGSSTEESGETGSYYSRPSPE